MLTVREAAARLGVSYSTFKQWIYKGSVRTVRTEGGHHRVADAEVQRLLARQGGPAATSQSRRPAGGGVLVSISGRNRLRGASSTRSEGRGCWPRSACVSATKS